MNESSSGNKFIAFSELVLRLAYLNFLWMIFTIFGFVLFGFWPSTVAMYAVIRRWDRGNNEVKTFNIFWEVYKNEWKTSNFIGGVMLVTGLVIYINLTYILSFNGILSNAGQFALGMTLLVWFIQVLYLPAAIVYYDLKIKDYFKQVIIIFLLKPIHTCGMVFAILIVIYLIYLFPASFIFFGGSVVAYIVSKVIFKDLVGECGK
ncbi:YesL family protein [Alteribacillus sp. HJP-4]|uniref:YesL family protein n=1 Tax=Alteribacillus sp. HJP-4 TaxID=2775394 RepID=UPI0035CD3663